MSWIIVISRYNLRPRYFIFNKNDSSLREAKLPAKAVLNSAKPKDAMKIQPKLPKIPLPQVIKLQSAIADPRSKLSFKTSRKGGLSVHITEIK